jgi:hypothetical protein
VGPILATCLGAPGGVGGEFEGVTQHKVIVFSIFFFVIPRGYLMDMGGGGGGYDTRHFEK